MAALTALLKDTTLEDLSGLQHVTILRDTATVEQALKTLASKRILSAPVITAGSSPNDAGGVRWPQDRALETEAQLLGFIDVRDILSSFLRDLKDVDIQHMKMLQRMRLLEERGTAFATRPIKDMAVFGGDGDFVHTSQSTITLQELISNGLLNPQHRGTNHGSTPNEAVHRVAIHDAENKITNIISQTDIVRFLYMNAGALGPLAQQTAEQLGWSQRQVACVSPETSAIEAMALMNARRITALAVVDGVGKIIGNFSISEMRTIMAEHFGALSLPVGEFLALEHGTEFVGYTRIQEEEVVATPGHRFVTDRVARSRPRTPGEEVGQTLVVAPPAATFLQIMELIVCHRLHRVYIMDEKEHPVGVVTCTDVLKVVTAEAQRQAAAQDSV